jgi:hypothetical protein
MTLRIDFDQDGSDDVTIDFGKVKRAIIRLIIAISTIATTVMIHYNA